MKRHFRVARLLPMMMVFLVLVLAIAPVFAQDEVTVTITAPGHHTSRVNVIEEHIAAYEQMKADAGEPVNVEFIPGPPADEQYKTQLALDFGAGVGPDVYLIDSFWISEFADAGYTLPLDDRLAEWEDWNQFFPGMQEIVQFSDQTHAVMVDTDVRMLWYRKDIFEQVGLPVPFEPQSWQEIWDAAATIKEAMPDIWPIGVQAATPWGEGTTMQGFYMLLLGSGGMLYDFEDGKWIVDSPALRSAFQAYEDLYINNQFAPVDPYLGADPWIAVEQELFHDGQMAMMTNGSWMWGGYGPSGSAPIENRDEVLGWTPMPAMEPGTGLNGADTVSISGGWAWAINPGSPNADPAWELIQYLSSAENQAEINATMGNIITRADAATGPYAENEYLTAVSEAIMPVTTFRPALPEYSRISAEVQEATERIITGEATAEEALEMFAQAVEGIVGAENVKRVE